MGKVVERDPFKFPKRVIGITMDITEKVLINQRITESEAKYKSIFEHLNDAYCRFDFKGQFLEVNKNLSQMLETDESELLNNNLKQFFQNKTLRFLYRKLKSIIHSESFNFETEITNQAGKEIPISISARLITQQGNGIIQALIRDVTERRIGEKTLLEEKQRFKVLVEHSPNVHYAVW